MSNNLIAKNVHCNIVLIGKLKTKHKQTAYKGLFK